MNNTNNRIQYVIQYQGADYKWYDLVYYSSDPGLVASESYRDDLEFALRYRMMAVRRVRRIITTTIEDTVL